MGLGGGSGGGALAREVACAAVGAAATLLVVLSLLPSWPQLRQISHDAKERTRERKRRPARRALRLLLVRHGESAMNVQPGLIGGRSNPAELTPRGERQARQPGRFWQSEGFEFDAAYSSTARRAIDTGSLALAELDLGGAAAPRTLSQRPELLELSQGGFEGRSRAEVYTTRTMQSIVANGMFFRPGGVSAGGDAGESQFDVESRVRDFIERELLDARCTSPSKPFTVVLFMHGLAIRCFLRSVLGSSFKSAIRIDCDNTSITELAYSPKDGDLHGWKVIRVNDCTHLTPQLSQQSVIRDT